MEKSQSTNAKPGVDWTDKFGLYGLLVIALGSLGLMYFSSNVLQKNAARTGHDTWVDGAGRLHVLGIVLGETSLRDAEIALKSRSDVALYLYSAKPGKKILSLEAYFPSIADHSKVVLGLVASEDTLSGMKKRASRPRTYPNGVARMNLASNDVVNSQNLTVAWIKLVPSVRLDAGMLVARFGEPDNVVKSATGKHYLYKSIGLDAYLDDIKENNSDIYYDLTFVQPDAFTSKIADGSSLAPPVF